jgi:mannosyltransferase OCH1-like enzyme
VIPKIIWQTYELPYEDLSDEIKHGPKLWMEKNPDWSYRYMDAKQREEFVLKEYGQEWLEIFNNCPLGVMKANIWRFMVLCSYGGIYLDLDLIPQKPMNEWIDNENNFIANVDESEANNTMFNIQLLASNPKNKIFLLALAIIKDLLFSYKYPNNKLHKYDVYNFTGETVLRNAIKQFFDIKDKIDLDLTALDFNSLELSKNNKFYFYNDKIGNFNVKDIFVNIDGAKTWADLGYTDWQKNVITNEQVRHLI